MCFSKKENNRFQKITCIIIKYANCVIKVYLFVTHIENDVTNLCKP